jgi:phosphate transport system protein
MTRIRFQQSLDDLKEQPAGDGGLAEQAIQRAIEAYRVRDLSICDLVSRSEIAINRLERDIDQAALDLLAMEQPMAIDLRFILSVIKINADLERVGDAAKSISDRVRSMEQMAVADLPVDIPRMASLAADMVRKSLQSFIEADAEMARTVLTMDDAVDAMNRAAYKALTKVMEEQSHLAPQALNALMICRSLERVADHATNIAEDVIFWVQGADVRHHKSSLWLPPDADLAFIFLHPSERLEFLAPVGLFMVLAVLQEKLIRSLRLRARPSLFTSADWPGLKDRWAGTGETGERFLDPLHPYARDLDLVWQGLAVRAAVHGAHTCR